MLFLIIVSSSLRTQTVSMSLDRGEALLWCFAEALNWGVHQDLTGPFKREHNAKDERHQHWSERSNCCPWVQKRLKPEMNLKDTTDIHREDLWNDAQNHVWRKNKSSMSAHTPHSQARWWRPDDLGWTTLYIRQVYYPQILWLCFLRTGSVLIYSWQHWQAQEQGLLLRYN